jgi:hypothetical protein
MFLKRIEEMAAAMVSSSGVTHRIITDLCSSPTRSCLKNAPLRQMVL